MTKRSLVSVIIGALVIGAASTTFAAANPFSDVPADSWAYDAVSKLANDGVVNGYPEGDYRGQQTMTRYEMAQIVAKAMTKTDMDKADKVLVDKLAAEFSDELDNLGVRVADLEKKADNVKWSGRLKYSYAGDKDNKTDDDDNKLHSGRTNDSQYEFRLEPKAFIGDSGWTANARIRYYSNAGSGSNSGTHNYNDDDDSDDITVDRIYAEGNLLGADAMLGKLPVYTDNALGSGMILDDSMSGAAFTWGLNKDKSTYITAGLGRYDFDHEANSQSRDYNYDGTADVGIFEFGHKAQEKGLSYLAGYYTFRNLNRTHDYQNGEADSHATISDYQENSDANSNIWSAGLGYKFDKNVNLYGIYAKSNMDAFKEYIGDSQNKAYDITLQYKGAKLDQAGSYGLYVAYRYLGEFATLDPTYDSARRGYKGIDVGAHWTVAKNILTSLYYFKGKDLSAKYNEINDNFNRIYGSIEFFF